MGNCTLMKVSVSGIMAQDGQLIDAVVLDVKDLEPERVNNNETHSIKV
jgi:hypothetical protein